MELYPLVMEPSYRSGQETPWGGHSLRDKYRKKTPDEKTGESLEISALPGHESRVANGAFRGKTLQEVFLLWKDELTGCREERFPLLLKLLDARQCLSVQVHPDDAYAQRNEGKTGKSEAWYILDADPGAKLVYGLDTHGEGLRSIIDSGRLETALHWVSARPGDVFYIPGGTIHALGPGIQCYEIQQSSDVTYRLWDWGRTGQDGKPRELHTEKALDVADADRMPGHPETEERRQPGAESRLLVDDPHFRLSAVDLDGVYFLPAGRMQFVTATVPCTLQWDGHEESIDSYQSVLIPAGMQSVRISGKGRILVASAVCTGNTGNPAGFRETNKKQAKVVDKRQGKG